MINGPRPAEQRSAENMRYRDRHAAAGIVRVTVMVPAERVRSDPGDPWRLPHPGLEEVTNPGVRNAVRRGAMAVRPAGPVGRQGCSRPQTPHQAIVRGSAMVTRSLITRILRGAGGMMLAACLPRLTLAQADQSAAAGTGSRRVAPQPLSTPTPPQPISPDALGQAQAHLAAARVAYERGHTAEAEDALERAETDLLNQPPGVGGVRSPDSERAITDIGAARRSLAGRDRQGVLLAISDAASETTLVTRVPSSAPAAPPAAPAAVAAAPAPMVTYALLPGHWALQGVEEYAWVPPETILPPSGVSAAFVKGHYVWRNGEWKSWVARALRGRIEPRRRTAAWWAVFKRADEVICRWRFGGTGSNLIHNAVRVDRQPDRLCVAAMTRRYRGDKSCHHPESG